MFKKFTVSILVVLTLCIGMVAMAAPYQIYPWQRGNSGSIIDITHPETIVSTTTQADYLLSGITQEGVAVTAYVYNGYLGRYEMLSYTKHIGASGVYYQSISLTKGNNKMLIRADAPNGDCELVFIEINLLVDTFWDKIRRSPVDLSSGVISMFGE